MAIVPRFAVFCALQIYTKREENLEKQRLKLWWWAFTSTTRSVSTLHSPLFCGTSGARTDGRKRPTHAPVACRGTLR